jgi:hypothetical protein
MTKTFLTELAPALMSHINEWEKDGELSKIDGDMAVDVMTITHTVSGTVYHFQVSRRSADEDAKQRILNRVYA